MSAKLPTLITQPRPGDKTNKLTFLGKSHLPDKYEVECECGERLAIFTRLWGKQKGCRKCGRSERFFEYEGRLLPLSKMCEVHNVEGYVVSNRIARGIPEQDWFKPVSGEDSLYDTKREARLARDFHGKKFSMWLVLPEPSKFNGRDTFLTCRCECGTKKMVDLNFLRRGSSKSCGCFRKNRKTVSAPIRPYYASSYPIGTKVGLLTVTAETVYGSCATYKNNAWVVAVKCDCGTEKVISLSRLRNQATMSCGCLRGGQSPRAPVLVPVSPTREATIKEISEELGLSYEAVRVRLLKGQPLADVTTGRSSRHARHAGFCRESKVGKKFGDWTILPPDTAFLEKKDHLLCQCACGTKRVVAFTNLSTGASKSCGRCRYSKAA